MLRGIQGGMFFSWDNGGQETLDLSFKYVFSEELDL